MSTLLAEAIQIDGGAVATVITTIVVLVGGGVSALFYLYVGTKDKEATRLLTEATKALAEKDQVILERERALADAKKYYTELESVKKSYAEIAAESQKASKDMLDWWLKSQGKPPVLFVAPVVSESHSDSTLAQRETAAIQTMRATMAALKLAAGLEARAEPGHAVEVDKPSAIVAATEATVVAAKDAAKQAKAQDEGKQREAP